MAAFLQIAIYIISNVITSNNYTQNCLIFHYKDDKLFVNLVVIALH